MARPGRRTGSLGLRLVLAFVGVALAAVAALAGLAALSASADISAFVNRQQAALTHAAAVTAANAWDQHDRWAGAKLGPIVDLAVEIGVAIQVRDASGTLVRSSADYGRMTSGSERRHAIFSDQRRVGQLTIRFSGAGLARADQVLRTDLWVAIAGATVLAALLAIGVAMPLSRRITLPVDQLIRAARARGRGQIEARTGDVRAPRELHDLAIAFDQMADSLDRQEVLRRNVIADVAHELRTPIAVLQAGHEALLDGVAEPSPGQLTSLRDEVLRLAGMVDDLQRLASAEAAALQLTLVPCDLASIAATAADSLARVFDVAGVSLQRRLNSVQVMADPGRLHDVITNLLSNAVKFTPAGGYVAIEVGPSGHEAILRVSDTGAGIPPDELPRIFDRFFRGRLAGAVAGSGIGLAVVAELVRAHNGRLDVSSEAGQGTQVTLTLPRA
jgi:two-component system, OmpR family, sensor histidine kinase BaeS